LVITKRLCIFDLLLNTKYTTMEIVKTTTNFIIYTFNYTTYYVSYKGQNDAIFAGSLIRASNFTNRAESYCNN